MFDRLPQQHPLFSETTQPAGPVECLGLTFENDAARRAHFLEILRQKLQDPEFRQIEGFPIGSDDDILAISDPPYFTICPNPFIPDLIEHLNKPNDTLSYQKEPFATDVSEGRHTWLYKAHTYHTKVPPKAIRAYIEHYTRPGDFIVDGFAGSGMSGVANMLASKGRNVILSDLSPAAVFIASIYSSEVNVENFKLEAERILSQLDQELGWMYTARDKYGKKALVNYYVWSDVFICSACGQEIIFWDAAFDEAKKEFKDSFSCPKCGAVNTKNSSQRASETTFDPVLGQLWTRYKQVPVIAALQVKGRRQIKRRVEQMDIDLLNNIQNTPLPKGARKFAQKMLFRDNQWGDQWKNCLHLRPITHAHQLFVLRQLHYIGRLLDLLNLDKPEHRAILFACTSVLQKTSRLMVYNADGIGRVQKGTLYISSVFQEMRLSHILKIAIDDMQRAVDEGLWQNLPRSLRLSGCANISSCSSATALTIPSASIDYIFVDPPFGANIPYSEVNFLWEAALGVFTNTKLEAVESQIQEKRLAEYQMIMTRCFQEYYRVLKPGRWMTVEFHNSKNSVWVAIQEALEAAGFVVADVRTLDKKQGSFKQVTTTGAVKQDLIISAYKPSDELEDRFRLEAGTPEGAWDFVKTHLRQLPIYVEKNGKSEVVAERMDYLLFDRMIAFHVQRGITVPLSASEFYTGLVNRFAERDGMYFLPDQVVEYDKKRMLSSSDIQQIPLIILDEASAIQWLRQVLLQKPQTYSDIYPAFVNELRALNKYEKLPELSDLLENNFLRYDGREEVPTQIHTYLSTNFKEMRGLPKDHPSLCAKAKDRWYVPDPNKAADLEKVREKALLKEFDEYKRFTGKVLKSFRMEAMRTGFRKAWQEKDYTSIIQVAQKIPEAVLQEDPKLTMWYDQALTRAGGG